MTRAFIISFCVLAFVLPGSMIYAGTYPSLTIISGSGYKFHLYLDGHQINKQAESAICVRMLRDRFYSCTIDFTDRTQDDVTKRHLLVTDPDNHNSPLGVVYRTQKEPNGRQSLVLVAQKQSADTSHLSIAAHTTVYDYTPDSAGATGVYGTIHVDTMFVTALITGASDDKKAEAIPAEHVPKTATLRPDSICSRPMSNTAFQSAKAAMNTTSFDESKLKAAKALAAANCLSSRQVMELCFLLDFDQAKLELARYAYPYCYDRQNYKKVIDVIQGDSYKAVLNAMIIKDYPVPVTIYH